MKFFFSNVPGCKLYTCIRKNSLWPLMFPQKFKNSFFFGTFQNSCSDYSARPIFASFYKTQRHSCSICFSFLSRCLPFLAYFCKVTFDIRETYLEPRDQSKMKLFAKIVKSFQEITIFPKSSILDVCLGFWCSPASEHINNHFHQIYLSDNIWQYLEYKLTTRFYQPHGKGKPCKNNFHRT